MSDYELEEFQQTVRESPPDAGYDEPAGTTTLVRHHLVETYDVEYSIPSCRRLLKEAGLSYQKLRPSNAKSNPDKRERFDDALKKAMGVDAAVVCVDQTKRSVNNDPSHAWFLRNS